MQKLSYEGEIMMELFTIPDWYHFLGCFIIYSILGWFVESIYMSFCNKKITNRGFMVLPFCPIYGFGATLGCVILSPFLGHPLVIYFVAAISATIFEFIVAKLMLAIFGEFWWDYNNKPLNYKGMICVESTVAWGFYGLFVITFLNVKIMQFLDFANPFRVKLTMKLIIAVLFIDFVYHFLMAIGINVKEKGSLVRERWRQIIFR